MIRQARQSDLQSILSIYNHAILNTTAVYTYEPVTIDERETWFHTKLEQAEPIFVYLKDGQVVGFATYGAFRNWPAYQYTVEHSIYVDPETRNEGVASQLLVKLIEEIKTEIIRQLLQVLTHQILLALNCMKNMVLNYVEL